MSRNSGRFLALVTALVLAGLVLIFTSGCTDTIHVRFESCDEAREAGAVLPLTAADPGWNARLDEDGDGQAC